MALKNRSIKHIKNSDSINIHAHQNFPTQQDEQISTLCFRSKKDKDGYCESPETILRCTCQALNY